MKTPHLNKVPVYEIFFSYQGEGFYVGIPQIFVRFAGCNLKCDYCDTKYSQVISHKVKFLTQEQLINKILKVYNQNKSKFKSFKPQISFTGGEPLLQAVFLKDLLPKLKKEGFVCYLETNGTLPNELKKIISYCDIVVMDFKFVCDTKKSFWAQHKQFLNIAKGKVFVKAVITNQTKLSDIKKSIQTIKAVNKNIKFYLQPSIDTKIPKLEDLYLFKSMAEKELQNVYLMPQMHKIFKVR